MKNLLFLVFGSFFAISSAFAQQNEVLKVKSYKLENGFTVFLNEDPTANKVFGAVMVNTGAKHELPEATGMAHYLEHLLFKGTETFGTSDYEKEKPYLDSINILYTQLGQTTDEAKRLAIQQAINQQALQASEYGLPNEFDKLLKSIGSTGINAFTSYEMTYYHNSFPAHEILKWLDIYAERFQKPIFRSFQSELEVVYEEKNRASDDFEDKIFREMQQLLFPNLPYGQWSVLGKTEHLKNPPINKMYEFFNTYYVANNMALILCGNFKPEDIMPTIKAKFGMLKSGDVPSLNLPAPKQLNGREITRKRITPVKASFMGFHTVGENHPDRKAVDVCEYLLSNNARTGYIDKIQLNNEMLYCGTFASVQNDVGAYTIYYVPKVLIQSLGAGEKKIQTALDQIKDGSFSDQQLLAAKQNLSKNFNRGLENLTSRGIMIGNAFNLHQSWEKYLQYPAELEQVSKEEVMRVARKYFGENMANLISRTGFPKKDKLAKPPYKPTVTDQKEESDYVAEFKAIKSFPFQPRFLDFDQDVKQVELAGGHKIWMSENPVNDVFSLRLQFKTGSLHQTNLPTTIKLMNFAGAGDRSSTELKEAFAALGCNYYVTGDRNYLSLVLSGNEAQLEQCLALVATLLHEPKVGPTQKEAVINDIAGNRKLEKRSPSRLGRMLLNYAIFGEQSPYLQRSSEKALKKLDVQEHLNRFQEITRDYQTEILFVGNTSQADLTAIINKNLGLSKAGKADEFIYLEGNAVAKTKFLIVDDKKARQSQIYFYVQGEEFDDSDFAKGNAFMQYFSGGFSGLILQEIREYRSLAYSAGAVLSPSPLPTGKSRLFAFVGCQADKTTDAISVMIDLFNNLPQKEERIPTLRQNMQLQTLTNFPSFSEIPQQVLDYQRQGLSTDPNKMAYAFYQQFEMKDLLSFYEKHLQGKPMIITIYGDKSKVDIEALKKLGTVEELKLSQIANF